MYGYSTGTNGYYRVLRGTIGYSFRVLGRLGSPAVSRFYRVLQGPPARGTSGTHRGTLGTHGYLTGVLTGVLTGNSGVTHRGTHGYPQVLAHAWAGFNATLFAYGQTGSGKTHTMVGEVGGAEYPGSTGGPREYRREYPPEYP